MVYFQQFEAFGKHSKLLGDKEYKELSLEDYFNWRNDWLENKKFVESDKISLTEIKSLFNQFVGKIGLNSENNQDTDFAVIIIQIENTGARFILRPYQSGDNIGFVVSVFDKQSSPLKPQSAIAHYDCIGTIEDPYHSLIGLLEDKKLNNEFSKEEKTPKPYKNEPVLKNHHFDERGFDNQMKNQFFKDCGKLIRDMSETDALFELDRWLEDYKNKNPQHMRHLESFQDFENAEPTNENYKRILGLLFRRLKTTFTPKWLRSKPLPKAPKLNFRPNIGLLDPHKRQIVTEFHGIVEGMLGKETADRIASVFTDASIVTGVEGKRLVDWVGKQIRPKLASAREGSEGIYMDEFLNFLSAFKEGKMSADEILKYLPENLKGGSIFRKNVYDALLKATKLSDDVSDLPLWQKFASKSGRQYGGAAAELAGKPLVLAGSNLPQRISNRWFISNPQLINFETMKTGAAKVDNMQKLNQVIALAIETKKFDYIPRKGFEKLGFGEGGFREFIKNQVLNNRAMINRIDQKMGEWSLTFK